MSDLAALHALTVDALANQDETEAERKLGKWLIANRPEPAVLHWRALLLRALDRHEEALGLLEAAIKADPDNAELARNLAQVSLEAGLRADGLFERALQLDPASIAARRGLVSAYFAAGRGDEALALLAAALRANPGWTEGYAQYAQLATLTGQSRQATEPLLAAIERFPDSVDLRAQLLGLLLMAGDFARAADLSEPALARLGDVPLLLVDRAAALDELGRGDEAADLFAKAGIPGEIGHATWLVRHHLRRGDPHAALSVAEPWLAGDSATQIWPYVSLAWRMIEDTHADWLERQEGLIASVDLAGTVDLAAVARSLRSIHQGSGRFVDQSVRGGTQTDGPLFARIEPEIRSVRKAVAEAMAAHAAALPDLDHYHPQLALPRDKTVRFAGSWSVRLEGQGFHASHHHPMGWFSAVLYVAAPERLEGEEGQLELGAPPPELGIDLKPFQKFVPKPGRLVIFPSTMWHATLPFSAGERMTIAFDTARPQIGDAR